MPSASTPWQQAWATITRPTTAWRVALALLVAVVSYLALTPQPPSEVDLGWDKLNHVSAFFMLAVVGRFGFPGHRRELIWTLLGLLAFGGLIEIVQAQVPGRDAEWADLLADSIGMAAGALFGSAALRWAGPRS